jgi:HCNGP-like protein
LQISQPQPQAQAPAVLGPTLPPGPSEITDLPEPEDEDISAAPGSPYTVQRNLLRDLTLPTHPNLDIPPSPPGSPNPSLNKKVDQFLDLKKKGIHFNSKLANSTALRNPALMDKLMDFVELGPDGEEKGLRSQYVTTLPSDVWNPTGSAFPDWAFRGPLKESQDRVRKEHEAERAAGKRGVDFVRGTSSGTAGGSGGEAGGLSRGSKRKAGAL